MLRIFEMPFLDGFPDPRGIKVDNSSESLLTRDPVSFTPTWESAKKIREVSSGELPEPFPETRGRGSNRLTMV
jgi:hypothetical protein